MMTFTVDGQRFSVKRDGDTYHYEWLREGVDVTGFSGRPNRPIELSLHQHRMQARAFLAGMDVETGRVLDEDEVD